MKCNRGPTYSILRLTAPQNMTFTSRSFYLPPDLLLNFKRLHLHAKISTLLRKQDTRAEEMDELPFSEGKKSSEKNSRKELPGYLYFFVCVFECECVCVCASAQSCPTLWNPMGCSPPASSVHGIFQAIIMEWVGISYSRNSFQPREWTCVFRIVRQVPCHCATWKPIRCYGYTIICQPIQQLMGILGVFSVWLLQIKLL